MGQGCCTGEEKKNVSSITADTPFLEEQDVYDPMEKAAAAEAPQEAEEAKQEEAETGESTLPKAEVKREQEKMPEPKGGHGSQTDEFEFTLIRNPQENIGLNLDALDGVSAFVDDIIPGAVQTWNSTRSPEEGLQVHDRVKAVNGVRGETDKLLSELKSTTTWKLSVHRPVEMRVVVDCKKHPSLGLDLKYSPNGNTLLIADLGDGAVKEWNRGNQEYKVKQFDRIVSINDVRGTARSLLEAAANSDGLDLIILHYE